MRYRTKPVMVYAMQMPGVYDQDAVRKVAEWMVDQGYEGDDIPVNEVDEMFVYGDVVLPEYGRNYLMFDSRQGDVTVGLSDWVLVDHHGEFYSCKPDIFSETHEKV